MGCGIDLTGYGIDLTGYGIDLTGSLRAASAGLTLRAAVVELAQGVLSAVLKRHQEFVNAPLREEVASLKKRLGEYESFMDEHVAKDKRNKLAVMKRRWKTVLRTVHIQQVFGLRPADQEPDHEKLKRLEDEKERCEHRVVLRHVTLHHISHPITSHITVKMKAEKDIHLSSLQASQAAKELSDMRVGICSLPSCDWLRRRVYALFPRAIGSGG
eukprot:8828876-Pyramimonas_sp.AAC.1